MHKIGQIETVHMQHKRLNLIAHTAINVTKCRLKRGQLRRNLLYKPALAKAICTKQSVQCLNCIRINASLTVNWPVTVAEGSSRACTVFIRSEAGIVGSNPTQGMDV
jgi:hypothetical protein